MTKKGKLGKLPALIDNGDSGLAFLLTHGAGGDMNGAGLSALAGGLSSRGHLVVRFDLPYRAEGRATPPKAELSAGGFAAAFRDAESRFDGLRWIAGGKSYGGRVASLAVAGGIEAAGLLFYGYPLHAPGRPDAPRTDHWNEITVPSIFLQGTHDPFCDLRVLEPLLRTIAGEATLEVVQGGDHSLRVSKGRSADGVAHAESEILTSLAATVAEWAKGR